VYMQSEQEYTSCVLLVHITVGDTGEA